MKTKNICFDCEEEFNDIFKNHKSCKNKGTFYLESIRIGQNQFNCLKIKDNIFFGVIRDKMDNWDVKLIDLLNKKDPKIVLIIFNFLNKSESNNFSKEKFGMDHETFESGYTYLKDFESGVGGLIFNRQGIDFSNMDLILDLFLDPIEFDIEQRKKITSLYVNFVWSYIKKLNFDFVSAPDLYFENNFTNGLISDFNIYKKLKHKAKTNPLAVKNYVYRFFKLHDPKLTNKEPSYNDLISFFIMNVRLRLIDLSIEGTKLRGILFEDLKQHRDFLFNFKREYSELKPILDKLYLNWNHNDMVDINSFIKKLEKDVDFVLENITTIYERPFELLVLLNNLEKVLFKLQSNELGKMKYGDYDTLSFLEALRKIEKNCKNKEMLFMIKSAKFQVLSEYAIISQDKNLYKSTIIEAEELFDLGKKVIEFKNEGSMISNNIKEEDIIPWNRLAYTSFCLKNLKDFKKYRHKYEIYLRGDNISPKMKISYFFSEFLNTEDNRYLLDIMRLYNQSLEDDFISDDAQFKIINLFSKSFLEKEIPKKLEYLKEAIEESENLQILPGSLQKDSTSKINFQLISSMLKYLWEFIYEKSNSFFEASKLNNAVEIAKKIRSKSQSIDVSYKWASKILLIENILKGKPFNEIEEDIKYFKNPLWKDSNFINQIKNFFEFNKTKDLSKMKIFINTNIQEDIFGRIIYKMMKNHLVENYSNYLNEINEIKNLDILPMIEKFKKIVERDAVTSFWKNKNKLIEIPEEIGRNTLMVFFESLNFDPSKEEQMGYKKKTDIIIRDIKGKKIIIETKMGNSKSYVEKEGIENLKKYYNLNKNLGKDIEMYYLIFIHKNNFDLFKNEYEIGDGKKAKTIKIDIRSINN